MIASFTRDFTIRSNRGRGAWRTIEPGSHGLDVYFTLDGPAPQIGAVVYRVSPRKISASPGQRRPPVGHAMSVTLDSKTGGPSLTIVRVTNIFVPLRMRGKTVYMGMPPREVTRWSGR